MRKCDSCGKPYQESRDVFCPHCGAIAEEKCSHKSSFDIKKYDRGEIYQKNNPQYKNTTYQGGYEPHAQRQKTTYNKPEGSFGNTGKSSDQTPKIDFPNLVKTLTNPKGDNKAPKPAGIIIFVVVIAFNLVTGILSSEGVDDYDTDYEYVTEIEEDFSELYTMANDATIEMVDADGDFKTFTLTINSMAIEEKLSESVLDDISSGVMAEGIVSEDTFVEMLVCDFSKKIVDEQSYDNALGDAFYYTGDQIDGKCKYEFSYTFDYDDIVYLGNGVDFYLEDGSHINATLPFTAFSISEDGKITYYYSESSSETAWNTVFTETENKWEREGLVYINFDN